MATFVHFFCMREELLLHMASIRNLRIYIWCWGIVPINATYIITLWLNTTVQQPDTLMADDTHLLFTTRGILELNDRIECSVTFQWQVLCTKFCHARKN